jgi:hypothetical protein
MVSGGLNTGGTIAVDTAALQTAGSYLDLRWLSTRAVPWLSRGLRPKVFKKSAQSFFRVSQRSRMQTRPTWRSALLSNSRRELSLSTQAARPLKKFDSLRASGVHTSWGVRDSPRTEAENLVIKALLKAEMPLAYKKSQIEEHLLRVLRLVSAGGGLGKKLVVEAVPALVPKQVGAS